MKQIIASLLVFKILSANDINATISSIDINMTELQMEEAFENEIIKG